MAQEPAVQDPRSSHPDSGANPSPAQPALPPPPPSPPTSWAPVGWDRVDRSDPTRRPKWAIPVVLIGLLAAAAALWFDALFLSRHLSSPSRYDSFALLPVIALVPFGVICLLVGGLAAVRPMVRERPWIRIAVVIAVLAWAVVSCFGPGVVTDVQPAI
jgi:hypothetical protein